MSSNTHGDVASPNSRPSFFSKRVDEIRAWLSTGSGKVITGAAFFVIISLLCQACSFVNAQKYQQALDPHDLPDGSKTLRLKLTYPTKIRFEEPDTRGRPIFARLAIVELGGISTITSSLTPTSTVINRSTISTTPALTLTVAPTITPTVPSPISTPATITATSFTNTSTTTPFTATIPLSYTISFIAQDEGLIFTDQEGNLVDPSLQVVPNDTQEKVAALYVHRVPLGDFGNEIRLQVQVFNPAKTQILAEPITLNIGLEWSISAFFRRFGQLLFGPATTLASTAVGVIVYLLQKETEWRKKREDEALNRQYEEAQRKLNQKREDIKNVQAFIESDLGKAVREWWNYHNLVRTDSNWADADLRDAVDRLEEEIRFFKDKKWQLAILEEAVGHFNNGNISEAIKRARLVHEIDTKDESQEALAARLVTACLDKNQNVINIAREIKDSQKCAQTALWLLKHQDLGLLAGPIAIDILAQFAGHPTTIKAVQSCLTQDVDGQRILKESEFDEPLQQMAQQKEHPEVQRIAHKLQVIRRKAYIWPGHQRWPNTRLTEDNQIVTWLQEIHNMHCNPFGPLKAELEPFLFEYKKYQDVLPRSYPNVLNDQDGLFLAPQPVIIFGAEGHGKTTTALLLTEKFTEDTTQQIFPVYHHPPINLTDSLSPADSDTEAMKIVGHALAETLRSFLMTNPYAFLDHDKANHKSAMAHLLAYSADSPEHLSLRLDQIEGVSNTTDKRIRQEIRDLCDGFKPEFGLNRTTLLDIFHCARPLGFTQTYILIDVALDAALRSNNPSAIQQVQSLLNFMIPLAKVNVHLKLLLPKELEENMFLPDGVPVQTIRWEAHHLVAMLETRLSHASDNNITTLNGLFDQRSKAVDDFIKAAQDSPRELIHLGNALLKYHIAHYPDRGRIDEETLDAFLELKEIQPTGQTNE